MAKLIFAVLLVALHVATSAAEPLVLSVARGFLEAGRTKVGALQGLTNATIQAGRDGINVGLNTVQDIEAAKSNALRAGVNITRALGTEALAQTRNLNNHLPSGLRGVGNLGVGLAQGGLNAGANVANAVFTGAQALVNGTLATGRSVNGVLSRAAQRGVNLAGNVAGSVIGTKSNAVGALQRLASNMASGLTGGSVSSSATIRLG